MKINIDYLISRSTIIVGVFTLGLSVNHTLKVEFSIWDVISSFSTAGLLFAAFYVRKDFKKIKKHDIQTDLLNTLIKENTKKKISDIINSLFTITKYLEYIIDKDINNISDKLAKITVKNLKKEVKTFKSNRDKLNTTKNKLVLIENNKNLLTEFKKIQESIEKIESQFHPYLDFITSNKSDRAIISNINNELKIDTEESSLDSTFELVNILNKNTLIDIHIDLSVICENLETEAIKLLNQLYE